MVVIDGLGEVTDRPIVKGAAPSNLFRIRRYENCRDPMSLINQASVELDPCHPRHLNVGDQARGCGEERRCEELGCRGEHFDSVS